MPKFTKLNPKDVRIGRGRSAYEARQPYRDALTSSDAGKLELSPGENAATAVPGQERRRRARARIMAPDNVIVINERHLRRVLLEFAAHYNDGRPRRTLELMPPNGPPGARHPPDPHRRVRRRSVLGGLTHEYMLDAA